MDLRQQTPTWIRNKTLQKPIDVILINMPFGSLQQPSIGLSLLKATLTPRRISTKILYFTLQLANQIGLPLYKYIAAGNPRNTDLVGEWIFSETLFGSQSKQKAYIQQILHKEAEMFQESSGKRVRGARVSIGDIVSIRDNVEVFLEKCAEEVKNYQSRIVGFTSVFQQQVSSLALAQRLKEQMPNLLVVFGGANCEGVMGAEMIRQFSFIDAIVSGEGEQIFPTLVERCLAGECFDSLQGVYTQRNISLLSVNSQFSTAPSVRNMDALPFPDFDDFFEQWDRIADEAGLPKLLFETYRGCWWGEKHHCTFCGLNGQTSKESRQSQRTVLSSRRAPWLIVRRPEDLSTEDQHLLDLGRQAHAQVMSACTLAQAFARMIRTRNASALTPWLHEASHCVLPELRTFAAGIKRDQAAVLAALTYEWSQGQGAWQVHRLKLLKRQSYGRAGFDVLRHRVLARSA